MVFRGWFCVCGRLIAVDSANCVCVFFFESMWGGRHDMKAKLGKSMAFQLFYVSVGCFIFICKIKDMARTVSAQQTNAKFIIYSNELNY